MGKSCGLADIIETFGDQFRKFHKLTKEQHKVLNLISVCRTAALGGHLQYCEDCIYEKPCYNSCRNRHCPNCQHYASQQWLEKRLSELLPTLYFHVVFTVPHRLNDLASHNRKLFYGLLFKAASQTLIQFGKDKSQLGAQLGFFGMLHTWGQTLWFHPHLHFVVPGGGLSLDGKCWVPSKKGEKFLFHVKALSAVFQGKLVSLLKKSFSQGKLEFEGDGRMFELLMDQATSKKWVVYAKKPFSSAEDVVRYVGRYTHRIGISNSRIQSIEQGKVRFSYRDYKAGGVKKEITLLGEEFLNRFVQHVLPKGFMRIRHYGFLAGGQKKKKLAQIQEIFRHEELLDSLLEVIHSSQEKLEERQEVSQECCPRCGGKLKSRKLVAIKKPVITNFALAG